MKQATVRIGFGKMWADFDPLNNWFLDFLRRYFPVQLSYDPDYLIYAYQSPQWERYRGTRIFFTGENIRPDMERCDWAFTFDHADHDRHYRLPLYRLYGEPEQLVKALNPPPPPQALLARRFCNFVYSNPGAPERIRFFDLLSRYKKVDAPGSVRNNMDNGAVGARGSSSYNSDKRAFIGQYKFTIAFENSSYPGYTTEKLTDPMTVHSLPIYWGNPAVGRDFNTDSFVDAGSLKSLEEAVEAVVALDRDDDAYLAMMARPWFVGDRPNEFVAAENIRRQFERIFAAPLAPARSFSERARTRLWLVRAGMEAERGRSVRRAEAAVRRGSYVEGLLLKVKAGVLNPGPALRRATRFLRRIVSQRGG